MSNISETKRIRASSKTDDLTRSSALCTHSTDKPRSWPWILWIKSKGKHSSLHTERDYSTSWASEVRWWKSYVSHPEPILLGPVTIIVCYCYWIVCQRSVYSCAFASEDLFIASGMTGFILCVFFFFLMPRGIVNCSFLLCGQPVRFIDSV